jgi:hypothetical protein
MPLDRACEPRRDEATLGMRRRSYEINYTDLTQTADGTAACSGARVDACGDVGWLALMTRFASLKPRELFQIQFVAAASTHVALVVQTLWAEKIQSTTDAGSLNTFGRNEIEVASISSARLRIVCLVILYKTRRVPDQELAADGVSGPV